MKLLLINIPKKTTSFDSKLINAHSMLYTNRRYDNILHYINLRICQVFYTLIKILFKIKFYEERNHEI